MNELKIRNLKIGLAAALVVAGLSTSAFVMTRCEAGQLRDEIDNLNSELSSADSQYQTLDGKYKALEQQYQSLQTDHQNCASDKEALQSEADSLRMELEELKALEPESMSESESTSESESEEIVSADCLYALDTSKVGEASFLWEHDYREYPIFCKSIHYQTSPEDDRRYEFWSYFDKYTVTLGDGLVDRNYSHNIMGFVNASGGVCLGTYTDHPDGPVYDVLWDCIDADGYTKLPVDALCPLNELLEQKDLVDYIKEEYTMSQLEEINVLLNDAEITLEDTPEGLSRTSKSLVKEK